MRSYLVAVSLLMAATPALAGDFYYVGKNPKTGDCDIFEVKPDGTNLLLIGESYPSRKQAKEARQKAPECQKPKGQ